MNVLPMVNKGLALFQWKQDIEAAEKWDELTGGDAPCPVAFDAEVVRKAMELDAERSEPDHAAEMLKAELGVGPD